MATGIDPAQKNVIVYKSLDLLWDNISLSNAFLMNENVIVANQQTTTIYKLVI